jgi:hypothetical protein
VLAIAINYSANKGSWLEVRDQLNRLLSDWSAYFSYGTRVPACRAVDAHVYDRMRHFLCNRARYFKGRILIRMERNPLSSWPPQRLGAAN